jgi:hypothetical protein
MLRDMKDRFVDGHAARHHPRNKKSRVRALLVNGYTASGRSLALIASTTSCG